MNLKIGDRVLHDIDPKGSVPGIVLAVGGWGGDKEVLVDWTAQEGNRQGGSQQWNKVHALTKVETGLDLMLDLI